MGLTGTMQRIGSSILNNDGIGLLSDTAGSPFTPTPDRYAVYEAYYEGRAYDFDIRKLRAPTEVPLPKQIQPVHLFVRRAVNWWPGHVYPGVMTADGLPASTRPNRIPYGDDTDERVRLAVQQAFLWGSQGFDLSVYIRTGSMLGDVFAEVVSDVERQKVYPKLIHPRFITDIEWNDTGDIVMYRVEIPQRDDRGRSYTWGKIVTKESITTLKDGRPHGYDGQPETIPNPWGFVPGVFVQHQNVGGQHGDPCFAGTLTRMDGLNGVATAINQYMMKFVKQFVVVGSEDADGLRQIIAEINGARSAASDTPSAQADDVVPILAANGAIQAVRFFENMGLADAVPHIERLIEEIEKDFPELTLYDRLMALGDPSGVAIDSLSRAPQNKLDEVSANYDSGIIRLGQMCISMAAQCLRDGVWSGPLTAQQQVFTPFTPESYDRGELAFSLEPRSILRTSMTDRIAQASGIERLTTVRGLMSLGMSEDEAREWLSRHARRDVRGRSHHPAVQRRVTLWVGGTMRDTTATIGSNYQKGR
jgi:hypothetical protein